MSALKPCPFCGNPPVTDESVNGVLTIECAGPCLMSTVRARYGYEGEADEAWNTRADAAIRLEMMREVRGRITRALTSRDLRVSPRHAVDREFDRMEAEEEAKS